MSSSSTVLNGKVADAAAVTAAKTNVTKKRKQERQTEELMEKVTKKQRKADRDPNAPKRPKTSYFFFCDEVRALVKNNHPESKVTEQATIIAGMWKNLTADAKAKFEKLAADAKAAYLKVKEQYDASLKDKPDAASKENHAKEDPDVVKF